MLKRAERDPGAGPWYMLHRKNVEVCREEGFQHLQKMENIIEFVTASSV
jgi:hypothetical protein